MQFAWYSFRVRLNNGLIAALKGGIIIDRNPNGEYPVKATDRVDCPEICGG
jgi:hypothetical protein